jgi:hypothetical protein
VKLRHSSDRLRHPEVGGAGAIDEIPRFRAQTNS